MAETQAALLYLHAQTALHPGTGASLGTVDLPVQRERITQWPLIQSSSIKGVLRATCRPADDSNGERDKWLAVFGPESSNAADHAGAITFTDARLLAFPVRSLKGVFAWVTCPAVIDRFARDRRLAKFDGAAGSEWGSFGSLAKDHAACPDGPLLIDGHDGKKLLLEEFEFTRDADFTDGIAPLATLIAEAIESEDTATRERLRSHLVVLHDDDFTHFVRHATEVVARIGLDYETKTVNKGALFYQEFLPAESIFYAVAIADRSRRKDVALEPTEVLDFVTVTVANRHVLQFGGDETIGKGLCTVRLVHARAHGKKA